MCVSPLCVCVCVWSVCVYIDYNTYKRCLIASACATNQLKRAVNKLCRLILPTLYHRCNTGCCFKR